MSEPGSRERTQLVKTLAGERAGLLSVLDGLGDKDLTRAVLPSGWTPAELVHHLTVDVERFWFRAIVAGEDITFADEPRAGWAVPADLTPTQVLTGYREECERADLIIAATSLDAAPAFWPEETFGSWRLADLRAVLMHVITETARHTGQLDAVREVIDGHQWLVLTG